MVFFVALLFMIQGEMMSEITNVRTRDEKLDKGLTSWTNRDATDQPQAHAVEQDGITTCIFFGRLRIEEDEGWLRIMMEGRFLR